MQTSQRILFQFRKQPSGSHAVRFRLPGDEWTDLVTADCASGKSPNEKRIALIVVRAALLRIKGLEYKAEGSEAKTLASFWEKHQKSVSKRRSFLEKLERFIDHGRAKGKHSFQIFGNVELAIEVAADAAGALHTASQHDDLKRLLDDLQEVWKHPADETIDSLCRTETYASTKELPTEVSPQQSQSLGRATAQLFAAGTGRGIFPGFLDVESRTFHHNSQHDVKRLLEEPPRQVPTKYLFSHADSAQHYLRLKACRGYTIGAGCDDMFLTHHEGLVERMVRLWGDQEYYTIVSLGIGEGKKEAELVRALNRVGVRTLLVAIDINMGMIHHALDQFKFDVVEREALLSVMYFLTDFDAMEFRATPIPKVPGPLIYMATGGTIGNQGERRFLHRVKRWSNKPAYLLFDFQKVDRDSDDYGYGEHVNLEFVAHAIQLVCGESVCADQISAVLDTKLGTQISDVRNSPSVTMQCETAGYGTVQFGYSTRYDPDRFIAFLQELNCEVRWRANSPNSPTEIVLCQL